jgi:hypothetical protein
VEAKSTFGPQQEMCLEGLSLSKLFHVEQFWVADQNRRAGLGVRNVPRGTFLSGRRVEIVPRGTILEASWIVDWINKSRVGSVLLME